MESLPVTLIVKAPNQQIEDQKIRCETSWTINKLKLHLSEVYPSKPPHHEQKLIYSGQLLNDSVVLKDVLRQYEGQDTHTVHLVCTSKHTKMNKPNPRPVNDNTNNTTTDGTPSVNPNQNNNTSDNSTRGNVSPESVPRVPQSGMNMENRVPGFGGNVSWVNFNGQLPQMDVNQYQMQLAMMQQAYIQYMTQYMQLATGQTPTIPSQVLHPNQTAPLPNQPQNQPDEPQGAAPGPPAAQPANENEERDWLDVFYMLSRAMVLFSVVYFYSSPVRFVFVLFLGIALYLYQIGFFRNININNNTINGAPNAGPQEEQAPTRLMVAWTFVTTFFASLIPEIPNVNV